MAKGIFFIILGALTLLAAIYLPFLLMALLRIGSMVLRFL
jgi:hypothetical protein